MKKLLIRALAVGSTFTGSAAFAGQTEDILARLGAIEKENAAIRRENAALSENKALRERNTNLKSSVREPQSAPAKPAPPPLADAKPDPFGAYAADLPVAYRAPPPEAPGQFRIWVEGGAIWTGGDRVLRNFELADFTNSIPIFGGGGLLGGGVIPGQFDLTPKIGWEAATGFDYRFPGSRWHANGQFRYGEGGKTNGTASSSGSLDPTLLALLNGLGGGGGFFGGGVISSVGGNETFTASYRERHWLADIGVGYELAGYGRNAMQVKGGLRVQEFTARTNTTDTSFGFLNFAAPVILPIGPGIPITSITTASSTLVDTRDSFLGAGPRIGLEGSVPFAGSWSFDYLGDLAVLFGTQKSIATTTTSVTVSPAVLAFFGGGGSGISTANNQRFATMLSADIQVGISYWITQNVKLGASYRLDALINVQNTEGAGVFVLTPDRYTHGPRLTLTGQFDSL